MIITTPTYLNVDDCAVVHPHRKYSILENHSDLIQQLLFQRGTVELLGVWVTENRWSNTVWFSFRPKEIWPPLLLDISILICLIDWIFTSFIGIHLRLLSMEKQYIVGLFIRDLWIDVILLVCGLTLLMHFHLEHKCLHQYNIIIMIPHATP